MKRAARRRRRACSPSPVAVGSPRRRGAGGSQVDARTGRRSRWATGRRDARRAPRLAGDRRDAPRPFPTGRRGWGEAEVLAAPRRSRTDDARPASSWCSGSSSPPSRPARSTLPPVEVRSSARRRRRARRATPPDLALEVRSRAPARRPRSSPPTPPRRRGRSPCRRSFWWTLAALALAALALAAARRAPAARAPAADPLAAPELSPLAELERALGLLAAARPRPARSRALARRCGATSAARLGFRALETHDDRGAAPPRRARASSRRSSSAPSACCALADQIKFARAAAPTPRELARPDRRGARPWPTRSSATSTPAGGRRRPSPAPAPAAERRMTAGRSSPTRSGCSLRSRCRSSSGAIIAAREPRRAARQPAAARAPAAPGASTCRSTSASSRSLALVVALGRPRLGYSWEEATTEGIDIQIVARHLGQHGRRGLPAEEPPRRRQAGGARVHRQARRRPHRRDDLRRHRAHPLAAHHRPRDARRAGRLDRAQHRPGRHRDRRRARQRREPAQGQRREVARSSCWSPTASTTPARSTRSRRPRSPRGWACAVYTIGVGREGRVPVPVQVRDPLTGRVEIRRVPMEVQVDEKLLRTIAERTGGSFFSRHRSGTRCAQVFDRDRPAREDAAAGEALHALPRELPAVRLDGARLSSHCRSSPARCRLTAEP